MFITFEGGEGTGKSTQVKMLADHFKAQGKNVRSTREPGGTIEGEAIRNLLVSGETGRWSSNSEMLLAFAAREVHLKTIIRPHLAQGDVVICDRFLDSTAVYQTFAGNGDDQLFDQLRKLIVADTMPDLTIVLDIDPHLGVQRSKFRMHQLRDSSELIAQDALNTGDETLVRAALEVGTMSREDRFERMGIDFHERVRSGFRKVAEIFQERCILIDATPSIEAVHYNILSKLHAKFIKPRPS